MIVYADTGKASIEHLEFNFSMLGALTKLDHVVAALGPAQSHIARTEMPSVDVLPLDILADPPNKLGFFRKLAYEIRAIVTVLRFARKNSATAVVFGYVFPMAQWLVHLASKILGVRAFLILHGDVGAIAKRGIHSWMGSRPWVWLNIGLSRLGWIECLVLEQRIAQNLAVEGVHVRWIDHPYRFDVTHFVKRPSSARRPIVLTFAGTLSYERGYEHLMELSTRLRDLLQQGSVSIRHVGTSRGLTDADLMALRENGVQSATDNTGAFLTREQFQEGITASDFLLILVNQDIYRFICSAAILDCLKYDLPFIALRSPLITPLFAENLRPGLSYVSVEEMAKGIQEMLNAPSAIPQFTGLEELRRRHGIDAVALQLRNHLAPKPKYPTATGLNEKQ